MSKSGKEVEIGDRISRFLKGELKKAGVTYDELVTRLADMGIDETKPSIANKLARGTFSATFLWATLKAIGRESITLDEM